MKRVASLFVVFVFASTLLFGLAACGGPAAYQDGVYSAEFKDFDSYGYKDYLRVTVAGGAITQVEYDALNAGGGRKTEDADYASRMSSVQDTSPPRYTADLQNQLLLSQKIEDVAVIAGATWSSECFSVLFTALEESMYGGSSGLVLVDNVPER